MIVYFGTNYTATLAGDAIHAVPCGHCGGEYFYTACRITTGAATSPYNIGQGGAQARAGNIARERLHHSLRTSADPVPCPFCGRLQADMVRELARKRYGPWKTAAWVLSALVLTTLGIAYACGDGRQWQAEVRPKLVAAILVAAGLGVAAWSFLNSLATAYDPDADVHGGARAARPSRSTPLPPAPPALVRTPWPAPGDPAARPAAETSFHTLLMPPPGAIQPVGNISTNGWVTVQLQRVGFPKSCAVCLKDADTTYGQAVRSDSRRKTTPASLPLCNACGESLRRRWWAYLLLIALPFVVAGVIAARFLAGQQAMGFVAFAVGPLTGLFFGYTAACSRVPPHRCKDVDPGRGFFALRFKNAEYQRLMMKYWADPETHARVVSTPELATLVEAARERRRAA